MSYTALPDRRMPYDDDGTVVGVGDTASGITSYPTSSQILYAQGLNAVAGAYATQGPSWNKSAGTYKGMAWLFFPEEREVSAIYCTAGAICGQQTPNAFGMSSAGTIEAIEGSNDTTNGMDGNWELAGLPQGVPVWVNNFSWRSGIVVVSFTGAKKVIRIRFGIPDASFAMTYYMPTLHVYGEKAAGETADDILYLDGEISFAEFTAPADFGDRPLGTTQTRTFKVKNSSATLTANLINLQCNDADFAISENNSTWVTTINIASLAAGASSSMLYVRNTTPDPGAPLGPRFARIVCTVDSWT